ncbi:hypothetical protein ZIOFF_032395 [Zingiber officinale]|uniref:HMA domain-containing protein n=1 Tax=Zingiber officinale TaxID=94328 RepID=A0A8J5GMP5_ZINOF|nr:hypothetical protein ZIOFF_032395 [Zingiber officinale]
MMPVAEMAELLEEYTAAVAGALEYLLLRAPIPWRIRTLILRRVPFASPPPPIPPPSSALRFRFRHRPPTPPPHRALYVQTVELKVRMCCAGCERVVKRALRVDSVEVEVEMEKVTVTRYVDRNKVLKEVRRSGKKAEFWPNPDWPLHFTIAEEYFRDEEAFRDSYNYRRHGYNGDRHGRLLAPLLGDERASNLFNDDDVNACSVM